MIRSLLFLVILTVLSILISCGGAVNPDDISTGYTPQFSFQWVLSQLPDPGEIAGLDYVDVDGFEADSGWVAQVRSQGSIVIGYVSVGSLEDWRPDVADFPEAIVGDKYDGWEGERWLDIGNLELIKAPLEARLDMLASKGFDGIEPDNLDGYETKTGFDITEEETRAFLDWLIGAAHQRGLLIGQKNIPEFTADYYRKFDFVLTEDAYVQGWEEDVQLYRTLDKPVFMVEYTDEKADWSRACRRAEELDYTFLLKNRELDLWYADCDGDN